MPDLGGGANQVGAEGDGSELVELLLDLLVDAHQLHEASAVAAPDTTRHAHAHAHAQDMCKTCVRHVFGSRVDGGREECTLR